jgi:universal stress protein E
MRSHGVQATAVAEWDFPAHEAIIRRARRTRADLIVAECAPGRHIAPLLLRLTDWELLRFSPVPVLVVKSARFYRHPAILAAIDPLHQHAKPTRLDDEILRHAAALQAALRGTLHAVHAYAAMAVGTPTDLLLDAASSRQVMQNTKAAAQLRLDRALSKTDIPRSRRYVIGKRPQDAILEATRRTASAIVVMGAVSRSGLKSLLIGNTAEQLLVDLMCDVLVVKPRRARSKPLPSRLGNRAHELAVEQRQH